MTPRPIVAALFLVAAHLLAPAAHAGPGLETRLIRLPAPLALQWVYGEGCADADALFRMASDAVDRGQGELLDQRRLPGDGGETVVAETYSFPAEYELVGEGRRAALTPLVDNERKVGTVATAFVKGTERGAVEVSLDFEYHLERPAERPVEYPEGKRLVTLDARQPEFRYHKLSSRYLALPGRTVLVAMVSPARIDAPGYAASLDLLFARVEGRPADGVDDPPSSDTAFLSFSVPDAIGVKVEAQGKPAPQLLEQLIDAFAGGRAELEAVAHNHQSLRPQCDDPVVGVLECQLPVDVRTSGRPAAAVPTDIQPFPLGVAAAAYVDRRAAGDRVPWRLRVDLERPRAQRAAGGSRVDYQWANLELGGTVDLRGGEAIELVDVRTLAVTEPRRYFTFLKVRAR